MEGDDHAEAAETGGVGDGVRAGVLHRAARGELRGTVDGVCEAVGAGEEEPEAVAEAGIREQFRVQAFAVSQVSESRLGAPGARCGG